jgi:hypothetical protein
MPDRTSPDFRNRMLSELQDMAGNIRNFLFTSNLRGIKLLDPAGVLKNHREEDSWDNDPVHPKNKIYEEMAKLSVTLCEQAGEINIKKRPRRGSDGSGGPTVRAGTAPDLHGRSDSPSERPPGSRATHSGRRGHPGGGNSGRGMRGFSFGAVDVRTLDAANTAGDREPRRHRQEMVAGMRAELAAAAAMEEDAAAQEAATTAALCEEEAVEAELAAAAGIREAAATTATKFMLFF